MNRSRIERTKKLYPKGTRIQLDYMDDFRAVQPGTNGTVTHVDDMGNIQTKWDNGRTLAVCPDIDIFHTIKEVQ